VKPPNYRVRRFPDNITGLTLMTLSLDDDHDSELGLDRGSIAVLNWDVGMGALLS
jgi:hypothetical protein